MPPLRVCIHGWLWGKGKHRDFFVPPGCELQAKSGRCILCNPFFGPEDVGREGGDGDDDDDDDDLT